MADLFSDKSHPATPRRRQQARAQGHVAKSQDLVAALVMTGGLLALWMASAGFGQFLVDFTTQQLAEPSWQGVTASTMNDTWRNLAMACGRSLAPVMSIVVLVAIAANLGQTGFLFLPQRIAIDFNRILPSNGFRRWSSAGNLLQLQFGLGKTFIVVTVALYGLWTHRLEILQLTTHNPQLLIQPMLQLLFTISLQVSFALVILALVDYLFQRWQYERSLRLSDAEMREELRNIQTDPQRLAQRHSIQQGLASTQLQQLLNRCDMILLDGNALAVAIECDPSRTSSPRVITRGKGRLAEQIIAAAKETSLPCHRQGPLTRTIYREAEAQQQISASHYQALAQSYHAARENHLPKG